MGTEDRKSGPGAVAANDRLYEYIVFRGSDVKDLRIEEAPKQQPPPPREEVPDDPAILGVSSSLFLFQFLLYVWGDERLSDVKLIVMSKSAKPCGYFRCLPSDHLSHSVS